jgi:hypothetical protein
MTSFQWYLISIFGTTNMSINFKNKSFEIHDKQYFKNNTIRILAIEHNLIWRCNNIYLIYVGVLYRASELKFGSILAVFKTRPFSTECIMDLMKSINWNSDLGCKWISQTKLLRVFRACMATIWRSSFTQSLVLGYR